MIGLLLGNFLWGPMGMILAVPIMAITKMICDNIDGLRPFGQVLGTGNSNSANNNTIGNNTDPDDSIDSQYGINSGAVNNNDIANIISPSATNIKKDA